MKPDDALDRQLAQLPRADLDTFRSQRLRWRAHAELQTSSNMKSDRLEPLLLAGCATVVLVRLLWFVVTVVSATV